MDALYLLGLTGVYSERWSEASTALDRALELDFHHAGALHASALMAHELGDTAKASEMIDRAHGVRPNDPQISELRQKIQAANHDADMPVVGAESGGPTQ